MAESAAHVFEHQAVGFVPFDQAVEVVLEQFSP
jgi:hypothetical protein